MKVKVKSVPQGKKEKICHVQKREKNEYFTYLSRCFSPLESLFCLFGDERKVSVVMYQTVYFS